MTNRPTTDETPPCAAAAEAPARPLGFPITEADAGRDRLARDGRYLINEAFSQSPPAIAYYVSQRLADLFPEKTLVESREYAFDPIRYASAGQCHLRSRATPYPHWFKHWEESADPLGKVENQLMQGWFEVEWEGERLDVLMMHWEGERGFQRHGFILAKTGEVAVRFLRTVCAWNVQPRDELLVYDGDTWEKDEDLFRAIRGATLESLVLPAGMKEELVADVAGFFAAHATYQRYGAPWKRGILFVGPPGNGKTHTVKALVNALPQPCLYVKSFRGYSGPDEHSIATVFRKARRTAPCILVIEDLDSLITKRNRSFFLNEMDGFAGNEGILTLATTNHPDRLDPAIADRPSRFDRKYHFYPPGLEEQVAYLAAWDESHDEAMRVSPSAVTEIAQLSEGFSFAYLKELCLAAVMAWIRAPEGDGMESILREQVEALRQQMREKKRS